jgi:hypothetical protein
MVVSAAWPLGYEVRPSRIFSSSPEARRTNLRHGHHSITSHPSLCQARQRLCPGQGSAQCFVAAP